MKKNRIWTILLGLAALFLAFALPATVAADSSLVRFDGGIGVIPVSSVAGVQNDDGTFPNVNRNNVRNVPPAGQIWVIRDLKASIDLNGRIRANGRGLLLGGGNGIGTNANASVFVTLFCENLEHSSNLAGVPLEPNGDFRIDDVLTPTPPNPCTSPVLLIRTANGGRWFAAGIPDF
jgi:hypothetical protein